MATWKDALARTRGRIVASLGGILSRGREADGATLEAIEETLLAADVPARLAAEILADLSGGGRGAETRQARLRQRLVDGLAGASAFDWGGGDGVFSLLLVGVNGSGKTTTAAKLAQLARRAGRNPLLGAADTFRAAGAEQLRLWAGKVGCDVVAGAPGADAASVAYDAMRAASARGRDVVIIDTAGRMHTRVPLMEELRKVRRSLEKAVPNASYQTWIVLDATLGQNALIQARQFHQAVPLDGVVVSKLDGSAKAGFLFGVSRELGIPIRFAGLGEQADDLTPFDPAAFVDALLGMDGPEEPD